MRSSSTLWRSSGRRDRFSVGQAEAPVEPRQLGRRGGSRVHGGEDGAAQRGRIRKALMGEQRESGPELAGRDADQGDIDAVGRGAAHDAGNSHGVRGHRISASAAALRRDGVCFAGRNTVAETGDLVVKGVKLLGRRRARRAIGVETPALPRRFARALDEQPAKGCGALGFGDQGFVAAQDQFRAMADFEQVAAGANGGDGGLVDGEKLENAAHLEIVRENDAAIADAIAQNRRDPERRRARGPVSAGRGGIGGVIHHNHGHGSVEGAIGGQIFVPNLRPGAANLRSDKVGVAGGSAEAGKMLAAAGDSLPRQAGEKFPRIVGDFGGIGPWRARAEDFGRLR